MSNGGFRSDLTMLRIAENTYRVMTGAFDGPRDKYWFQQAPARPTAPVHFQDLTSSYATIGLWGPNARNVMAEADRRATSPTRAFPYGTTQEVLFDSIPVRLFRISYVGELGWEIYVQTEHARAVWDRVAGQRGQEFGIVPVGAGVYGTTGRLEKGYRLMGSELDGEYTVVEAGLARPKVKSADFIGKAAYLKHREEDPAAILCTLTVEDHMSARDGIKRYMVGRRDRSPRPTASASSIARVASRWSPPPAPDRRSASSCCSRTSRRSTPSKATTSACTTWTSTTR